MENLSNLETAVAPKGSWGMMCNASATCKTGVLPDSNGIPIGDPNSSLDDELQLQSDMSVTLSPLVKGHSVQPVFC